MKLNIGNYILMLLCLILMGCSSINDDEDNKVIEYVKTGDKLPSFSVEVTDGEQQYTFSTSHLTGETVIVFFNTACSDCVRELPELNNYYLQHRDDEGFQMVAISREEGATSVADYWKKNGLQIPYSAQSDRRIYSLFATSIIPRVYYCDAKGIVTRMTSCP